MVNITLPFDEGNPVLWSANQTNATLIFIVRSVQPYPQGTDGTFTEVILVVDDYTGLNVHKQLANNKSYDILVVHKLKNPIRTPYRLTVGSPYPHNLELQTSVDATIDTSQPQQWFSNQTNLETVVALREQNFEPLVDLTVHLREPDLTTYNFSFSTIEWWLGFQIKELKPDLITPYEVSITSSLTRNLDVIKV
jgi:hypothetical protein